MRKWLSVSLFLFAAACDNTSNNGNNNPDMTGGNNNGGSNFSVVARTTTLAVGSTECANGGVKVEIGLDNGANGGTARDATLQDGEVTETKVLCNTQTAASATLTSLTPLGVGDEHCPNGGARVDYGFDNGDNGGTANDGILQTGEVDSFTYACLAQPANVLVVTTPLKPGDPTCPYGGQIVTSGLDDGKPAGSANNSILEPEEVDLTATNCNPAPSEVFPSATGEGLAYIDISGGYGDTAGIGSGGGGSGGELEITAYGASLNTPVEVRKGGSVDVPAVPTAPTFTAGSNPVVITANTTIPTVSSAPGSGPYVMQDSETGWPVLYLGANPATSLQINAGQTVTFGRGFAGNTFVQVNGDVLNLGTIKEDDSDGQYALYLACNDFINDTTGVVDLRGHDSSQFVLWATYGSTPGVIFNRGKIDTSGFDDTESVDDSASVPGPQFFIARGDIVNTGKIYAKGAAGITSNATPGASVNVRTIGGNLYNTGEVNVSGAGGDGSATPGGGIYFYNGEGNIWPTAPPIKVDDSWFGPGFYAGTGTLVSNGGTTANDYTNGGRGGEIAIRTIGGSVFQGGYITANGGSYTGTTGSTPGQGGEIFIGAFTWTGILGTTTPVVPSGVFVGAPTGATLATQGSIEAKGGLGQAGMVYAGRGGSIDILLDVTSSYYNLRDRVTSNLGERWMYYRPFALAKLDGLTQTASVRLLGYGGKITSRGGGSDLNPGNGGSIIVNNAMMPDPYNDYSFLAFVGTRLLMNDAVLDAQGGPVMGVGSAAPQASGGGGGYINFNMTPGDNFDETDLQFPRSYQPTQLLIGGLLDVSSPSNTSPNLNSGYGGEINVFSHIGQVDINAELRANGATISDSATEQGSGGYITATGQSITVRSNVNAKSGVGSTGGYRGYISFEASDLRIASTATIDNSGSYSGKGSRISLYGQSKVVNDGTVRSNGVGLAGESSSGANGGDIWMSGGALVNTGTITALGTSWSAAQTFSGGAGGSIRFGTEPDYGCTSLANTGTIDTSGGSSGGTGAVFGGSGGGIVVYCFGGMTGGTVRANGGDAGGAAATDVNGGGGGEISIYNDTTGTITATGGNATGPASGGTGKINGGGGGYIFFSGMNASPLDASGGNATGTGATVLGGNGGYADSDDGTNTACVDVSRGTPIVDANSPTPGTINGFTNMCGT